MRRSKFFQKTMILIISNIISGTLALIFSIILSREIGSKGMGLYQLVMSLYGVLIFVVNGGISVTMSKVAAEKKTSGNIKELYRTIRVVCEFEIIWSIIITALIAVSAGVLSSKLLSDVRTYYSILAFCPALIMTSLAAVYKGTYYGIQRVAEPAVIDIIEKSIKIAVMYPLVILTRNIATELSAASAVLAISFGEFISFILFFICFTNYKRKHRGYGKCDNDLQLFFNVIRTAFPIGMEGMVTSIFTTLIAILIPKRLRASGIIYETALSLLGKLQGMALNIAFFPMIITGAFNTLLIPSISEALSLKNIRLLNHRINTAFRLASITAFSSTAIILSISQEMGKYFYNDVKVGEILKVIAPALPIVYIELTTYPILNGLGKQTKLLINSIIVQTLDIVLLYIFMAVPELNIKGFAINFMFSALLGIYLNFKLIHNTIEYSFDTYGIIVLPFLCSVLVFILTSNILFRLASVPLIIIISYLICFLIYLPLYRISKNKRKL